MKLLCILLLLTACGSNNDSILTTTTTLPWVETPEPPNFGTAVDTANPNVLVLGDSISIGYTGPVISLLGSEYDIMHPADNCRNSYYTLNTVDKWLTAWPKYDVIVWNNGLWDDIYSNWLIDYPQPGADPLWYGTSLADYEKYITQIAIKLKATGARVIFFTTTDVPLISGVFIPGREILLNDIAKRVLPPLGIEIRDLNQFALSIPNAHVNSYDVHFTNTANSVIGRFVADIIQNP